MSIYGIIALSLISAILVTLIKQYKPELAIPVAIAAGCVVLLAVINKFLPLIDSIKSLVAGSKIGNEYLKIMIKALGICYITQFASDICNDFGQTSLSSKIELCGKIVLAAISLPLVTAIIKMITEMVGKN